MSLIRLISLAALLIPSTLVCAQADPSAAEGVIETPALRLRISAANGAWELLDKRAGVSWPTNVKRARFGEVALMVDGKRQTVDLGQCQIKQVSPRAIEATFAPLRGKPGQQVRVSIAAKEDGGTLAVAYEADEALRVENVRLLEECVSIAPGEGGYAVIPVREGLLIPADNSAGAFSQTFDTSAYEGCHMAMAGAVKQGAAMLISWDDPYAAVIVKNNVAEGNKSLTMCLSLRKSARSFTLALLGKGDYVAIGKAYRQVAKEKGWLVTWDEKLKENPGRARLFGASNFKLWSTLSRQMNEKSDKEESARVSWTFDEAAQVAEHLKNDLKLERVFFIMGGWIKRGYDNQHPDILPSAPECGGDEAFAQACKRIRALGYVLGLHDNYQDMYKDAPSWDESYLMKNADGSIVKGGRWAGGLAYVTCSQKAIELAKRPQNLPAVKKLTDADAYFIDTTYAAGLCECFDPKHPLTRRDDMKYKQEISDYSRQVFGIFGSECGREWAIPHADFFEGLTGVSGGYYHDATLATRLGASVIPLFEIVYRDCIAMYGKYGYDIFNSAEYVLHHISIGRPLNYHSVPNHLYWTQRRVEPTPLALRPAVAEFKSLGARRFSITYKWTVEKPVAEDWKILVHFTDAKGKIKFQNDQIPNPVITKWAVGEVVQGPFTVTVPEGLTGAFDIRAGLYMNPADGRALLSGPQDNEHRNMLGKVNVLADRVEFVAPVEKAAPAVVGDPSLYVRGDGGWAAGMHPMDRFVKNTHEILSPLYELTAQTQMTLHEFLTPDRKVRRSVFGQGESAISVIVNGSNTYYSVRADVTLSPNGFLIESPGFVAFCGTAYNGVAYSTPTMFTIRSLDGKAISQGAKARVFHGFGDARIRIGKKEFTVERQLDVP